MKPLLVRGFVTFMLECVASSRRTPRKLENNDDHRFSRQ